MGKIKILHIVEAMGGGIFSYLVDLVNHLADDYDIYIAYALRSQTPDNFKDYFDKRVHYIEVKSFIREINLLNDYKAIKEIRRIERQVRPDIIHLHSSKAGVIGRLAFNGKRIPMFYTPHGYSFFMTNFGYMRRYLFKIIEAICAKANCTTISCSYGEHLETLKLTKNAIFVNNSIDIKKIQSVLNEVEVEKHAFTVFTSGRICYQKNPSQFNEIAKRLPDIKFYWFGDGPLRDVLDAPNIKVFGWMSRSEVLKLSMNADVFILTSLWEGLPISLLEAMYMKKICLVSNCIGNRDVIRNNENGFLCNSVDDYISGILEAKNGNVDYLIEVAYKDVNNEYNLDLQSEKYREIYRNALLSKETKWQK